MRWTPFAIAVVLLAAPALSGCVGFGSDDGGEDIDETSRENDTGSGENETGDENGTGDDSGFGDGNESDANESEDDAETTWNYDNRTGTVSGTNAFVTNTGSAEESFTVDPNTLKLALNLSAEGGELEMCIQKPSGNESGNESGDSQESCDETVTTQEGNASFTAEGPAEGDWKATLRPANPGHHSIDYELAIAQLVEEEEGRF